MQPGGAGGRSFAQCPVQLLHTGSPSRDDWQHYSRTAVQLMQSLGLGPALHGWCVVCINIVGLSSQPGCTSKLIQDWAVRHPIARGSLSQALDTLAMATQALKDQWHSLALG